MLCIIHHPAKKIKEKRKHFCFGIVFNKKTTGTRMIHVVCVYNSPVSP